LKCNETRPLVFLPPDRKLTAPASNSLFWGIMLVKKRLLWIRCFQSTLPILRDTSAPATTPSAVKQGSVSIQWEQRLNGLPLRLVLEWKEFGGPPVPAPAKPDLGQAQFATLYPTNSAARSTLRSLRQGSSAG
jgi:hypothetical protein